uniref:GPI inositol-deacylase n=1 Tax=Xiphophorus couchianus TaxID=32473 RepID=A0A3B5MLY2_9TELE
MRAAAVAFYGAALGLLLVGLRELLTGFEENRCSMTYMFEYPEYRRVSLPRRVARLYPAYGLYLYGEGLYAQETRALKLSGAPVLFLPGNAGSYKQARSLGSVALRKAENMEGGVHLNVFTVDFNEELVALYGGSLLRQTHFLHESIKAILRLYKQLKTPPQSVALVGHSMGGVVARALFTLPRFNPHLVSLIITQASPHMAPVLALDPYLLDFYTAVRQKWVNQAAKLRNITLLSVGGGYRDYQVRSGLTSLPCPPGDPNKLSLVVRPLCSSPGTRLELVCKELVLATVRAFFDLIDAQTRQFTDDPERRRSILNHHFIRHNVRTLRDVQDTSVPILGSGSESGQLVLLHSSGRFCLQPQQQTGLLVLPPNRVITGSLAVLTRPEVLLNNKCLFLQFTVECEWQREESLTRHLHSSIVFSYAASRPQTHLCVQVYQAFRISVVSQCRGTRGSVYRMRVPWFQEDSFTTASAPSATEISGMLHTSRPDNSSSVLLQLHTAPNCQYKVSVRTSFPKVLGQVLRFCGPLVPVYTAVALLLACGGQLSSILASGRAADMSEAVGGALQLHKVNLLVYLLHILLSRLLPVVSCLPLPLAVAMATFSSLHLYRIAYFLSAVLVPLGVCCVL